MNEKGWTGNLPTEIAIDLPYESDKRGKTFMFDKFHAGASRGAKLHGLPVPTREL